MVTVTIENVTLILCFVYLEPWLLLTRPRGFPPQTTSIYESSAINAYILMGRPK